jgi:hypothetical protein
MSEEPVNRGRGISPENRARAIELVGMIRSTAFSDEEHIEFNEELERLIPHPAWSDLMFWHDPDLSDEEAVEEALRYRPIAL